MPTTTAEKTAQFSDPTQVSPPPRPARRKTREELSNRRPDIEAWLDGYGFTYEYQPGVPLNRIDLKKSLRNQARFEALDEPTVEDYATAYTEGAVFPPLVVHSTDEGAAGLVEIDGNHRTAGALRALKDSHDMYIVTAGDPKAIELATFEANARHGMRTSHEEKINHAVYAMTSLGLSAPEAARRLGLKKGDVQAAHRKMQVWIRARDLGIRRQDWDRLHQSVRNSLATVSTDEGFLAATKLTLKAGLRYDEVKELVQQLNASKSARKQVDLCEQLELAFNDRIQGTGGGTFVSNSRRGQTPRQRAILAIGGLRSALGDDPGALAKHFTAPERAEQAKKARETAERLTALAETLESM